MLLCPVIKLSTQLITGKSISPDDAGCQVLLMNRLRKIIFSIEKKIHFKNTLNFGAGQGKDKTFSFAGHTDVVVPIGNIRNWNTPPFEPIIKKGLLFDSRKHLPVNILEKN
ncbi:MAG: hypothetical protein V6006_01770 [Candidatus Dasytiphilus stammeri]